MDEAQTLMVMAALNKCSAWSQGDFIQMFEAQGDHGQLV